MSELAEPSLQLNKRQRAMLKEMGVQVWQPLPIVAAPPVASVAVVVPKVAPVAAPATINSGAASAHNERATGSFSTQKQSSQALKPIPQPESNSASAWRVGNLQTLYADTATPEGSRWLILIESPASALQETFNPFEGDAGKLLNNMLRAAQLHKAEAALLLPLVRGQGTGGDLSADLAERFASAQADVVLVMGRLAAQALLQSGEPLAKLRGQVQTLHSTPTIITIDPAYLLRNPLEKAKAWDDLCLGLSLIKPS